MRTGKSHWREHPTVDNDLTFGERAADGLKHWFGTWTALGGVAGWIAIWISIQLVHKFDAYPFILLNLCLSCLAAVQGIILQISANRQDRINAEAATHDRKVLSTLLKLQKQQMTILSKLEHIDKQVDHIEGEL